MAKEKDEHESKAEDKREGAAGERKETVRKKKMHLLEVRTRQEKPGGELVHHHTYRTSERAAPMAERGPVATSASPEEAGQHVAEQFAMNQGAGAAAGGDEAAAGGGEPPAMGAEAGA